MPAVKIEKRVPVPKRCGTLYGGRRKILISMKPGDSFVVEALSERDRFFRAAARAGIIIKTRKLETGGVRIWKIGNANSD